MIREYRISALTASIIILGIGLLLLFKPATSLRILCFAIAFLVFVLALTRLLEYFRLKKNSSAASKGNLLLAVIFALVAAYLALRPETIGRIIPTVLGIIILIDGLCLIIAGLSYSFYLPKRGLSTFAFGALAIILGVFSIRHSFGIQVVLMRFLGTALVVTGGFNLVNHFMLERAAAKRENATTVRFETEKRKDV